MDMNEMRIIDPYKIVDSTLRLLVLGSLFMSKDI